MAISRRTLREINSSDVALLRGWLCALRASVLIPYIGTYSRRACRHNLHDSGSCIHAGNPLHIVAYGVLRFQISMRIIGFNSLDAELVPWKDAVPLPPAESCVSRLQITSIGTSLLCTSSKGADLPLLAGFGSILSGHLNFEGVEAPVRVQVPCICGC